MCPILVIDPLSSKPLQQTVEGYSNSSATFSLDNGVYRFVKGDNYTENFGFQWNKFEKTQIDRFALGSSQSKDRFFAVTQWQKKNLQGENILEVGSGAGRFTEIVLAHTEANLFSVDYSSSVDANYRNNGTHPRLKLFQASIYELPFAPNQFDRVFCFGVLQHTPDFKKSVASLVSMVKPGGELVIDFYPIKGWYTKIHAKYILRPITKRMSHKKLLDLIESNVDWMIKLSSFFSAIRLGKFINRFLPICDIESTIPKGLDKQAKREWIILDTFDMFSPQYDSPQSLSTVVQWLREMGMRDVKGDVVAYGDANKVTYAIAKK
jgi:ubiquinone/menaquinone biosynthesis C-methylase UbiE